VVVEAHIRVELRVFVDVFGHFESRMDIFSIFCGNPVTSKYNSLTQKVCYHIIDGDNLEVPFENLQEVLLHRDELVVIKWQSSELKELVYPGVRFFKILCTDEH